MPGPLAPLLQPVTSLHGVGPSLAEKLARATGGDTVLDLLFHLPSGYLDRRNTKTVVTSLPDEMVTIPVQVVRIDRPDDPQKRPTKVIVQDDTGFLTIPFFRSEKIPASLQRAGTRLLVSGLVSAFGNEKQIKAHLAVDPATDKGSLSIDAVWPLTAGLFPSDVRKALRQALDRVPDLPEWHDPAILRRERWPGFAESLRALHLPADMPGDAPRARLAYDELLAHQLAMAWSRTRNRVRPGRPIAGDGRMRAQALARFGHALTPSQAQALAEIGADLAAPRRMLRLLQGDVGSGKTLVALLAMLHAAEGGHQAALMAPTEVLAKQHLRTLQRLAPIPVGLLTGAVKGVERRRVLSGLANGRLKLVVGTHALFQDAVAYDDLALAVIDEQHRFGVEQRLTLGEKGERTDVLVMTATPIPRTLLLTHWNEMEVSRLTEKPGHRLPIRTTIHSLTTLPDVIEGVGRALSRGDRVYWVCPMVSENADIDLAAAEARFTDLAARFGDQVGLAHGQQETYVRDRALADFAAGRIRLLVATTVIEVGMDVPEASVMVIEHAERFGLAQLHQLRGRVGRSAAQSYCLLLHDDGLTDTMRRRLTLLRDTEDGFLIADEDFRLRGGGDLLGKRQSGGPLYRLADPDRDERLIAMAAQDAAIILEREPRLDGPRGMAVRLLLQLFGRRAAVETLASG